MSPAKYVRHIGIMTPLALSSTSASSLSTASHVRFPINTSTFRRDASISFQVYRGVNHHKMQVKFKFGDHPRNFDCVMTFFDLVFS